MAFDAAENVRGIRTEHLKDGPVTYWHSDAMVTLAEKWLFEYLCAFGPKRPGDMEDDFCGEPGILEMMSNLQGRWRSSPFFPALARLVDKGLVHYSADVDGIFWYSPKDYHNGEKALEAAVDA